MHRLAAQHPAPLPRGVLLYPMETVAADINYSTARMLLCNTSLILNDHKWAQPGLSPHPEDIPSRSPVPRHQDGAADEGKSVNRPSNEQLVQLSWLYTTKSLAAAFSSSP